MTTYEKQSSILYIECVSFKLLFLNMQKPLNVKFFSAGEGGKNNNKLTQVNEKQNSCAIFFFH